MNRSPESPVSPAPNAPTSCDEARAERQFDEAALHALARNIKTWGRELGFGAIGISDTDLSAAEAPLAAWLEAGCHGEMDYMAKHGMKRARPAELVAGTLRVITARIAYLPAHAMSGKPGESEPQEVPPSEDWRAVEHARLADPSAAVVSIYARGRDYHKVMRNRLQHLSEKIQAEIGSFGYRVFTDSAPVLEVELAQKAGIGWRGKHTLLLQRDAGSLFFLGEIYVDVPLPTDAETSPERAPETPGSHCGSCARCIGACPTGAIVAPYKVDARLCISYLTIELKGSIPVDMRPLIGNRVYGCDDCQLVCPWNKFAQAAPVADFDVRHGLDRASLVELFSWSADEFDTRMQGSAIRRIGYESWLRNLAVGMGNALRAPRESLSADARKAIVEALQRRAGDSSHVVREHVQWALEAA
ncbi:tRNA epoxyqueuosine(34) reductase QueG [Paraburkholderia strydomiana]|uniref:tRNA epoxyqueuosine(34) reductase QueG n=1 Tax=Paraburkholderia strydomiana TaxID=1245417 RepID=UPI0038BC3284